MNYEDMSDFEVNGYVSMHMHGFSWIEFVDGCASHVKCGNERSPGFAMIEVSDYCNNPSDAWPIILEYQISIAKYEWLEKWDAHGGGVCVDYDHCIISNSDCSYSNKNPLRAAMVVFLMMQEQAK